MCSCASLGVFLPHLCTKCALLQLFCIPFPFFPLCFSHLSLFPSFCVFCFFLSCFFFFLLRAFLFPFAVSKPLQLHAQPLTLMRSDTRRSRPQTSVPRSPKCLSLPTSHVSTSRAFSLTNVPNSCCQSSAASGVTPAADGPLWRDLHGVWSPRVPRPCRPHHLLSAPTSPCNIVDVHVNKATRKNPRCCVFSSKRSSPQNTATTTKQHKEEKKTGTNEISKQNAVSCQGREKERSPAAPPHSRAPATSPTMRAVVEPLPSRTVSSTRPSASTSSSSSSSLAPSAPPTPSSITASPSSASSSSSSS